MVTYTCDKCGEVLHHGGMYMVKVGMVGKVNAIPDYLFCKECAKAAKAVLSAFVITKEGGDD